MKHWNTNLREDVHTSMRSVLYSGTLIKYNYLRDNKGFTLFAFPATYLTSDQIFSVVGEGQSAEGFPV